MPSVFAKPNKFNLSHRNSLTCEMGALVPFLVQEVLPGDEFRIKTDAIVRLAPMLAPVFGEIDLYTHYFFVPNRLVWSNWEKFITHGLETGSDSSVPPYLALNSGQVSTYGGVGSLLDYLDIDVRDSAGVSNASVADIVSKRFSALPVRVYNLIYNEWYRPEFLVDPVGVAKTDGQLNPSSENLGLLYRCWSRDYFTSANPFVQLGDPVSIGLGTSAVVKASFSSTATAGGEMVRPNGDANYPDNNSNLVVYDKALKFTGEPYSNAVYDPKGTLYADLTDATAVTINDLRTAFQLQRILERKARSGNRYVEYLASSFGVRSPDARLQRPEFLGGGKSPVLISEVLQTSSGTETSPQGNMAGHGFGASRTFAVNKAFTEHGYIMGILSIMPKTSFSQGRKRELCRWSWTDYAQPEFYHLGEQPVYKSELLLNDDTQEDSTFTPGAIFGYQPRYEEYRRKLSGVHGDFRQNMAYWHLGRIFSAVPTLNGDFMKCDPSKRIFAAGDQATRPCWVYMNIDMRAVRPLSKKGNPGMVDH